MEEEEEKMIDYYDGIMKGVKEGIWQVKETQLKEIRARLEKMKLFDYN